MQFGYFVIMLVLALGVTALIGFMSPLRASKEKSGAPHKISCGPPRKNRRSSRKTVRSLRFFSKICEPDLWILYKRTKNRRKEKTALQPREIVV